MSYFDSQTRFWPNKQRITVYITKLKIKRIKINRYQAKISLIKLFFRFNNLKKEESLKIFSNQVQI